MAKQVKVMLGGREYKISEKQMGVSGKWRDHLNKSNTMRIFKSMDGAVAELVAVADSITEGEGPDNWNDVNVNQVMKMAQLVPVLVNGLSGSIDEIIEMLFDYSPEIAGDKEWILENAFDREAVTAFCEVVKLCFPFLEILGLVRGSKGQPTSTNLPTLNGANGQKAMARQKKT